MRSTRQRAAIRRGVVRPDGGRLIFATRAVLARKCRDLAAETLAHPGTPDADREAAQKLIDETFAGASPQIYFEWYRTYLLALTPAIAQQLLELFGK